jgi:hypothetical protein
MTTGNSKVFLPEKNSLAKVIPETYVPKAESPQKGTPKKFV